MPADLTNSRSPAGPGLSLQLSPELLLRPLVQEVVQATLQVLEVERANLDGRLAYSEEEAVRLLGLEPWQLRGERLRSRIQASQIVGRRIRYLRQDLLDYLLSRRWEKASS